MRQKVCKILTFFLVLFVVTKSLTAEDFGPKQLGEATIADIHAAMQSGNLTAMKLVRMYLERIAAYDDTGPALHSIIAINPKALETAAELDRKFAESGFVGPLHGIPIVIKDNVDFEGMPTTDGSVLLKNSYPPNDAFIISKLREAGAIILAKSSLAEFASSADLTVSSMLPATTRNPYSIVRTTAGSSGGTAAAVAANFATVGLGTDTGSSVRAPAAFQSLVGFRSTMGLISRDGIAPLNSARDIAGPMARTVEDAVRVLDAIAGYDPADPATERGKGRNAGYLQFLQRDGLKGMRIGVLRDLFHPEDTDPEVMQLMNKAIGDMKAGGATIVDPFRITNLKTIITSFVDVSRLKYDFNNYLASLGPGAPVKTFDEIVRSKQYHPFFETVIFDAMKLQGKPEDNSDYRHNLAMEGILRAVVLQAMDEAQVDAIVYPTSTFPPRIVGDVRSPDGNNNRALSPPTGFPAFTVPMGFTTGDLPAGIQLFGRPFSEATLIRIAYSYEQSTKHRHAPRSTPPLKKGP